MQNTEETNWEAEIQVQTAPDCADTTILPEEWRNALESGGQGIQELMLGHEDIYHSTHNGFPVGFRFEFLPAEDRRSITALGTCHPAWNYQGDIITDLTNTVAWAELQVRLHDPRALQEALVELA